MTLGGKSMNKSINQKKTFDYDEYWKKNHPDFVALTKTKNLKIIQALKKSITNKNKTR